MTLKRKGFIRYGGLFDRVEPSIEHVIVGEVRSLGDVNGDMIKSFVEVMHEYVGRERIVVINVRSKAVCFDLKEYGETSQEDYREVTKCICDAWQWSMQNEINDIKERIIADL